MRITSAEPSPKHKGMLRIYIDGEYAFHLPESVWLAQHLYEKETWAEAEISQLRQTVLRQAAREAAIRYLSVKDRTEQGLAERLLRAGYDREVSEEAVAQMKTMGYIDDTRYARRYISDQLKLKSVSRKAIRMGLRAKGVSDEVLDEVLAEEEQTDDETALRGLRKKFGKYDLQDPRIQKKAIAYLMHRGFSYETVRRALSHMT